MAGANATANGAATQSGGAKGSAKNQLASPATRTEPAGDALSVDRAAAAPAASEAPGQTPAADRPNAAPQEGVDAGPTGAITETAPAPVALQAPVVEPPAADNSATASGAPITSARAGGPALPSDAPTVMVSFTFDDTYAPQAQAAAILEAHGLRGTFYVNSPRLHQATAEPDSGSSMSIADVLDLQSRGHDIGGHTLGHLSLTDIPEEERIREIMGDRAQLMQLGIDAQSLSLIHS
jgi:hypothetical protein